VAQSPPGRRPLSRDVDFIIPGDLTSTRQGVLDPATGAVYLSRAQAKKWSARRFKSAVQAVATRTEFAGILGATPYSLRRGGISLGYAPRTRKSSPVSAARA
jgi:hypothetical protein